jgi:hypothetical protein
MALEGKKLVKLLSNESPLSAKRSNTAVAVNVFVML